MQRNLTNLAYRPSLAGVLSADTNGTAVDRTGFNSASLLLLVGPGGITFDATNKIDIKVEHSDDGVTYTGVGTNDVQAGAGDAALTVGAGGIVKSLVSAQPSLTVTKIDYVGAKRHLRAVADHSGTHGTGTLIAAVFVLGHPKLAPVA